MAYPEVRLSMAEILERLNESNPNTALARAEIAAARARATTAEARLNPSLSGTREQLFGAGGGYSELVLSLNQTFELGGQRGLRVEAARRGVDIAEADLNAARLRLAFDARRLHVRAMAAEAALALLEEATGVFRRVDEAGRLRLAEGDISTFERSRLQIERMRYESLLAGARLERVSAGQSLAFLIGADTLAGGGIVLPAEALGPSLLPASVVPLDSALAAANVRAEVQAARADIRAAEAALALQRGERRLDLTVTGGYKGQADGLHGAVVGLSVPLPLYDRNHGRIAEAQAALAAAETRLELARRVAEGEVRLAWETYRALGEQLEVLNRDLVAESGGLLRTALVAYDEGEMTLLELLDAADAYRAARQATITLTADYLTAFYDLGRAMGRPASF